MAKESGITTQCTSSTAVALHVVFVFDPRDRSYKSPPPTASYYYYYRARPPRTETAAIGETFSQYITFLKSVHIRYCYRILSRRGAAKRCLIGTNPAPSCAVFLTGGEGGGEFNRWLD